MAIQLEDKKWYVRADGEVCQAHLGAPGREHPFKVKIKKSTPNGGIWYTDKGAANISGDHLPIIAEWEDTPPEWGDPTPSPSLSDNALIEANTAAIAEVTKTLAAYRAAVERCSEIADEMRKRGLS